MKYILSISFILLLFISCKENSNLNNVTNKNETVILKCNSDSAENKILNLDEIVVKNNFIDSISKHKNGISLITDSLDIEGISYYEIKAGFNSEIRFENYYTFYVDKNDCSLIKIFEPVEGKIITLSEWRNNSNLKKPMSLLSENKKLKFINLPFSFYEYFKDEYSEEKYPSFLPSKKLIDFLVKNNYEGEAYKCFLINSKDNLLNMVVSISRGDSEYFLFVTSNKNEIIDFIEIGSIGDENPITFKIFNDLKIEKYLGNLEINTPIEKYQINNENSIIKI